MSKVLNPKIFVTGIYPFCTLLETLCVVLWSEVLPVPRVFTDIWNSMRLFPSLSQAFCTFCKRPQHLWVLPVVEVVVILELLNLAEFLLAERLPVVVHLIGFPFSRVFVTEWDQATVVPILVHVLHAEEQLACRHPVLLVFQLQVLIKIDCDGRTAPTLSSKTLLELPWGPLCEDE